MTDTPWSVGEAALAHILGNSTQQAYARSDLYERRRVLMQEWADYVTDDSGGNNSLEASWTGFRHWESRVPRLGTVDILEILYGAPLKSSFLRRQESRTV